MIKTENYSEFKDKKIMKKVILLLMMAFLPAFTFMTLRANNNVNDEVKIRNTFYGCTLGKSTKEEVREELKSRGFEVQEEDGDLYIENITFAGKSWGSCQFEFYKGKLMMVGLGLEATESDITNNYEEILNVLSQKYGTFKLVTVDDTNNHKNKYYDDGSTLVGITYTIESDSNYNTLLYMDKGLVQEERNDSEND